MRKKIVTVSLIALFVSFSSGTVNATPYTGADIELFGDQYSDISGTVNNPRWFNVTDGGIRTNWTGWVEYSVTLDSGNWNVGLNVSNYGNLGNNNWYSHFKVQNSFSSDTMEIAASADEIHFGHVNLDLTAGDYTVRYSWMNDKWDPANGLDANIQIENVFFDNTSTAPVPEPATMLLFGTGLVGLACMRLRKNKKE